MDRSRGTAVMMLGAFAFFAVVSTALAQPEVYWERPLLKARVTTDAFVELDVWSWENGQYQNNGGDDSDSGLQERENDSITLTGSASYSDSFSSTSGSAQADAELVFNPPNQRITDGALITTWDSQIEIGGSDQAFAFASAGASFVMEAVHTLASTVHPPGTPVFCLFKPIIAWSKTGSHWITVDWVILGAPGTPVLFNSDGRICVSYIDQFTQEYVEVCSPPLSDGAGELYDDIEGMLEVGDQVTWIASAGTGNVNFSSGGAATDGKEDFNPPVFRESSSIADAVLWMDAVEAFP